MPAAIPCPPPLRAERKWSARTCWTRNGEIGLRWPNLTSEEYRWEAEEGKRSSEEEEFINKSHTNGITANPHACKYEKDAEHENISCFSPINDHFDYVIMNWMLS